MFQKIFSKLSEERKGEVCIFFEAILWGIFPLLTFMSLSTLGPLFSGGLSQLLSLFVIAPFAIKHKTFPNVLRREVVKPVILSAILIGAIFYSLLFIAGKYEDPVTIGILLLFEVPATYLVLLLFGKERVRCTQVIGSILVLIASFMVIYKEDFSLRLTSFLVIIAVFFPPMGNYYSKIAREFVSASVLLFVRGTLSTIFILIFAVLFEELPTSNDLKSSLAFIVPNGLLVFGVSKILWVEGIYRIPISKAISINSMFPIVTMLACYLFLGLNPSYSQLLALIPGILGVYLLTRK